MGWATKKVGLMPGRGHESECLDLLQGPIIVLLSRYQGHFPWGQDIQSVEVTPHTHLILRSRMSRAVPPLPIHLYGVYRIIIIHNNLYGIDLLKKCYSPSTDFFFQWGGILLYLIVSTCSFTTPSPQFYKFCCLWSLQFCYNFIISVTV